MSTQVPLELVLSVCKVEAMAVRQRGLPRRQWSAAAVVYGGGGEARQRLGSGGSGIGLLAKAWVGGALEGA